MLKRKVLGVVLTLTLLLSFVAFSAEAATAVDTQIPGSLTLTYSYDGQPFSGITVGIYRVADISQYADFTLTGAFSQLPVEVNKVKTQQEWKQVASTLSAYVTAQSIPADREAVTDQDGVVSFSGLPLGLYLVAGVRAEQKNGYCQFDSFMISVPDLNEQDEWVYDVVAKPKSVFHEVKPVMITYTVNKLWKDEGYTHLRPKSVSLELYKNGTLAETVALSAANNWTYSWTAEDDGSLWQVVEANVPKGYKVTLEQKGNFFFVTNGYDMPVTPPPMGDIFNPTVYLIIMGVSGLGLIGLGIAGKKGKKA